VEVAPSLWGLRWFTHKAIRFLGCTTKLRPKARRDKDGIRVGREALKQRAHSVIEELASEVSKARWMHVGSMSLSMC
jgi:hypothetical protein